MIIGHVDNIQRKGIVSGWLKMSPDSLADDQNVIALLMLDDKVIGQSVASIWRPDLGGPFGFELRHSEDISIPDYLLNRVKIIAKANDRSTEVKIWDGAFSNAGISPEARTKSQEKLSSFASIELPVGLVSSNRKTIVGNEGYLFVYEGGNNLANSYFLRDDDPKVIHATNKWVDVFTSRREKLQALGARYLQFIIPEKSSVLDELFPFAIPKSTTFLSKLRRQIRPLEIRFVLHDFFNFLNHPNPRSLYYKGDSHFSFEGTLLVMNTMLDRLGLAPVGPFPLETAVYGGCDLGVHLIGKSYNERGLISNEARNYFDTSKLEESIIAEVPGHVGSHIVWKNPAAKHKLKVVVYGNSFFERGRTPQRLSWWFARLFSEFHFIWSPNMDFEYIERVKPDVVIGQTIERFLVNPAIS